MRKVREILELSRDSGLSTRAVGRQTGVAATTVRGILKRYASSGLEWPLPLGLSDAALEARLYGSGRTSPARKQAHEPDWAAMNRELKRKHVTLQILWDEYINAQPDGYGIANTASSTVCGRQSCR